ncbi:MAG TPA: lysylphosphatidylglycerol synthase transmembrane domain-containing protein [Vicinamibacterales bacterium]|nr:lysylphosphatidylglycerol synthase transmembrane domain-containing protein [Vicinamibacterales bacterium]
MTVRIRTTLILLLTAGLLALFLRNADLGGVWTEIRRADAGLLAAAVVLTLATYLIRAWRWQYLVRPIGRARFGSAFRATVIGFAASFLLPARAGEFIRPYVLARRESLSATATFATIVLERLLDLVTVLLLFSVFLLFFDPGLASADPRTFAAVRMGAGVTAMAAVVGLVALTVLAGHPERLARAARRLERWMPARAVTVVERLVARFAEGMGVLRRPVELVRALALSVPLWMSIACGIWFTARAFHITFPYTGSFLVMSLLVVGVAVPTPGAIGGFHAAFRIAVTGFYGVSEERAVGAALVLHAVSFIPVTFLGIVYMAQEGLSFGNMRRIAQRNTAVGAES